MALEKLLEPGRIGGLELPNRLIFAPIAVRAAGPEGRMTDELNRFYLERAQDGPGLIVLGHTYCWREEQTGGYMGLWDDEHIAPLARLVQAVHGHGVRLAVQLGGRGTRRPDGKSMAPSVMRFGFEPDLPREITSDEIDYFVEHYGQAARRAREAGIDAVEIHAAHGKLVSLFLSAYSNRRSDEYGGSLEKRTLFARRIVAAVKREAGADFPVIFRYSADDMLEGGNTPEDGVGIARIMSAAGVDAFTTSAGNQERGWNTAFSYFFPKMCLVHLARPIGDATGKPVIAVGKIGDPLMAESVLREGRADFVSLGRPYIADPHLLRKARAGRYRDIRRCVYCLNCFTSDTRTAEIPSPGITCTVNPAAVREAQFENTTPTAAARRIAVIGGGLAGMEAARTLARRGHKVTLYEKEAELGGQWLVASHADYKSDFRTLIPWLIHDMDQVGVTVRTGTAVDATLLRSLRDLGELDAVVLATGAVPRDLRVDRPAEGGPDVVQGMDVIMDRARVGRRVVVVGGRYIGMEAADKLARQGREVSLVEALDLGHGTIARLSGVYRNRLVEADVHLYPRSPLLRFTSTGVDVANNGSMLSLPCDTVVLAIGTVPVNDLAADLDALGVEWHAAGDCKRIGDALYAIRDGAMAGRKL